MKRWHVIVALVVIGAALYAPNLSNSLFWDDDDWIVNNPAVHSLSWENTKFLFSTDVTAGIGVRSNYYRPVLMMSFALNWVLHGASPWGWHVVNNGLHILSAVLLFLLLERLLANRAAAAIAALMWLIHPVQTESVAYVNSRGDSLALVLSLEVLLVWWRTKKILSLSALAGLVLFILAILSKETAVLIPALMVLVLLACRYCTDSFWRATWAALRRVWPLIVLGVAYVLLRLTVLDFANTLNWYRQPNIYTQNVEVRIWTFLGAVWEYLRITLVPIGLRMEHGVPVLTAPWQWPAYAGLLIVALAVWWVVRSWRRGDRLPFFGVTWFFIALAPASGIVAPINALFYEHWLYVPLIGPAALFGVYGWRWGKRIWDARKLWGIVILVCVVAYAAFLAVQTVRRNIIWGKQEEFYLHILSYEPKDVRVLNNLANLYADSKRLSEAQYYLELAIEADPSQSAPFHNLANLMRDQGQPDMAIELYILAIQRDKYFYWAYRNLTVVLLEEERYEDALQVVTAYRSIYPNDAQMNAVYDSLTSTR